MISIKTLHTVPLNGIVLCVLIDLQSAVFAFHLFLSDATHSYVFATQFTVCLDAYSKWHTIANRTNAVCAGRLVGWSVSFFFLLTVHSKHIASVHKCTLSNSLLRTLDNGDFFSLSTAFEHLLRAS